MAKASIEYEIPAVHGLVLSGGAYYSGSKYQDAANANRIDGYTLFDAGIRYRTEALGRPTTFNLYVSNLTNKDYWSSYWQLGLPRRDRVLGADGILRLRKGEDAIMKQGFRQSMAWLHTWVGLIPGWILYIVFVFGTAAFFQYEIDAWMRPELPSGTAVTRARSTPRTRSAPTRRRSGKLEHLASQRPWWERPFRVLEHTGTGPARP